MSKENNFENSLLYYWLTNLVGSNAMFSFNLIITITAGIAYSFKMVSSPYILLIFGVISPIIFTLCIYHFVRNSSGYILDEQLPGAFRSRFGNTLLMLFDICLILAFATLIYLNYLNYFFFRFLQTILFPGMMLIVLRVLFISGMIERHGDEDDMEF